MLDKLEKMVETYQFKCLSFSIDVILVILLTANLLGGKL
jgi:hypothetical protein